MKVGLLVPHSESEFGGATPRWSDILVLSLRAEALGFNSLWIPDHFLIKYANEEPQGSWECWTLAAAIATSTKTIHIGTLVTSTSFRNPALIAKLADTVDEISGGRFTLGIGAGHHQPEYEAFGYPYDHRIGRFEESIQVIHDLLRNGRATYEGKFYRVNDCELRPRGPRAANLPILVGALSTSKRLLRLTAQFADIVNIWVNVTQNQLEGVFQAQNSIDEACRSVGRDPLSLVRTAGVLVDVLGRKGTPGEGMRPKPLAGTPRELADELARYADVGISEVQIYLDPCNLSGLEELAKVLDHLDQVPA